MKNGGRRPGAGRPKGSLSMKSLEKEELRRQVREAVGRELGPMIAAQIAAAKGCKYLVTRSAKGGKFTVVTEAMARLKQGSDEDIMEVWEKFPSALAFAYLLDQAIDKPRRRWT